MYRLQHNYLFRRKIVDKIDKDKDGKTTKEELGVWIKFTKDQHNEETIDKKWKDVIARLQKVMSRKNASSAKTVDPDGAITWEDHNEVSYGGKPGTVSCHLRCIKSPSYQFIFL